MFKITYFLLLLYFRGISIILVAHCPLVAVVLRAPLSTRRQSAGSSAAMRESAAASAAARRLWRRSGRVCSTFAAESTPPQVDSAASVQTRTN